jgi:hypothetical protein
MASPFESPRFLLAQTHENLAEFNAICARFFDGNSYANVVDVDRETGNKTFKVKFAHAFPGRARHIAATAINDVRHSLDQAVCAAVRAVTGKEPGTIYFPKGETRNDYVARVHKYIPDVLWPIFLTFESYPTGDGYPGGDPVLSNLIASTGANKHDITCKVGAIVAFWGPENISGTDGISMMIPPTWDWEQNEMVIGITRASGHIHYKFNFSPAVVFGDAGKLNGAPVSLFLSKALSAAEGIVGSIEKETARILASRA